ncbi:hypothetical protein Tco_1071761 [Tanacetum coccineum]
MSTQQDIYAAGSENRPPMLNKENYVPWSSRLLRYAKSRPNGKLIYNSIMNGPYVRRMIPEPENVLSRLDYRSQQLTKDILSRTDCTTTLTNLRTKFENAFNSEFEERMRKYTRYNAQSFNDAMICTMDSIRKYMLEIILHQQRTLHLLKQKTLMQTQEDHSNQTQALNSDSLESENSFSNKTLVLRKKTVIQRLHPTNQQRNAA